MLPGIDSLYESQPSLRKYIWLSKVNIPYHFGGKTYQAKLITNLENITTIMEKLNANLDLELDACLVTRYHSEDQFLSLHQDDEDIIDQSQSICNISIGSTRQIEFWDSGSEETGQLKSTLVQVEGPLVIMKPGCQSHLWHKVPQGKDNAGVRYSLSFRKVKLPSPPSQSITNNTHQKDPYDDSSNRASTHLMLGSFMHPSNIDKPDQSLVLNKSSGVPSHLIIGDSMAKGLTNPDTIILSRGGCPP